MSETTNKQKVEKSQHKLLVRPAPIIQQEEAAPAFLREPSLLSRRGNIVQPKLEINPSNDQYEQEVDHVADQVIKMPSAVDAPLLQPSVKYPDFLQNKIISRAGGWFTRSTPEIEANIEQMRQGGHPLPQSEKTFFENRMGEDFSQVRLHTGSQAIQTSRQLEAQAFTVGNHIAFNQGAFSPGNNAGRQLLAHELTHVVQQTGSKAKPVQRVIQRNEDEDNNIHAGSYGLKERAPGKKDMVAEVGKPIAAVGMSAGAGGGFAGASGVSQGSGVGGSTLSTIGFLDQIATVRSGHNRMKEAEERGDDAGARLGKRKRGAGGMGVAMGGAGVAQNVANTTAAFQYGKDGIMTMDKLTQAANYTQSAAGVAAGVAGIVGGSLLVGQGMWRIGKAASKHMNISDVRPISAKGSGFWKPRLLNREKSKAAIGALKIVAGGLGIAAGVLILASNPVGWAIGVTAAVVAGGMALTKLGSKLKRFWKRRQKKKALKKSGEAQTILNEAGNNINDDDPQSAERKKVVELSNEIAKLTSTNGKAAYEMRHALKNEDQFNAGRKQYMQYLHELQRHEILMSRGLASKDDYIAPPDMAMPAKEFVDAEDLLGAINVSKQEALSESGQELIEKKMAAEEAL